MVMIYELAVLHGVGRKKHAGQSGGKVRGDEMSLFDKDNLDPQERERRKVAQKFHEKDQQRLAERRAAEKLIPTERQKLEKAVLATELAAKAAEQRSAIEVDSERVIARAAILTRRAKMTRQLFTEYEGACDALTAGTVGETTEKLEAAAEALASKVVKMLPGLPEAEAVRLARLHGPFERERQAVHAASHGVSDLGKRKMALARELYRLCELTARELHGSDNPWSEFLATAEGKLA